MDSLSGRNDCTSNRDNVSYELQHRGHRRRSLLVLEGTTSPSLGSLLNESEQPDVTEFCNESGEIEVLGNLYSNPRSSSTAEAETVLPIQKMSSFHHGDTIGEGLRSPNDLIQDISRCQDQVEELIQLFSFMSNKQKPTPLLPQNTKPEIPAQLTWGSSPSIVPRRQTVHETPHTEQKFNSDSYERQEKELEIRRKGHILSLENARASLEQSLEDAVKVLDQLPRRVKNGPSGCCCNCDFHGTQCSYQDFHSKRSTSKPQTPSDRRQIVDTDHENHNFQSLSPPSSCFLFNPREELVDGINDRKKEQRVTLQKISEMEKWPCLEDTIEVSCKPCSMQHDGYQQRFESQCCSHSNMTKEQGDRHPDSCPPLNETKNLQPPTFRVLFQDPILHAPMSRAPSQSLSGMEASLPFRMLPKVERDAMSDCHECLAAASDDDDNIVMDDDEIEEMEFENKRKLCLRRTKSAFSVLYPIASAKFSGKFHPSMSLEDSSDWDIVEGGVYYKGVQNYKPLTRQQLSQGELFLADNSRMNPVDALWSADSHSQAFSNLLNCDLQYDGHQEITEDTEVSKIDQSVQCDLYSALSDKHFSVRGGSCCVSGLFRKKKHLPKKKVPSRMMIPASFLSHAIADSSQSTLPMSSKNGMLCGIRTAMKAAFRPPWQTKQSR